MSEQVSWFLELAVSKPLCKRSAVATQESSPRHEAWNGAGCRETGATGLEPATSGVTGRRSNQLNYAPVRAAV